MVRDNWLKGFLVNVFSVGRRRAGRRPGSVPVSAEVLEQRELPAATVGVLKEIAPGSGSSLYPSAITSDQLVSYQGYWYFAADTGSTGWELWRTDGTESGTQQFLDLRPGPAHAAPSVFHVANGRLFFTATNSNGVRSLYATDGTVAGTNPLAGVAISRVLGTTGATTWFYRDSVGVSIGAFWRSDGTVAGTKQAASGFIDGGLSSSVVFDGTIFFAVDDGSAVKRLWKIDNTTGLPVPVADSPTLISDFCVVGTTLYFAGRGVSATETQLWKMTTATATPAAVYALTTATSVPQSPHALSAFNQTLLFSATTRGTSDVGLWKTDGTEAGTQRILQRAAESSRAQVGDAVYFSDGLELWRTSGNPSAASTYQVSDLWPGAEGSQPDRFANANGTLFFTARNKSAANGARTVFLSDGTAAGTQPVSLLPVTDPGNFQQISPTAFLFFAENAASGRELFLLQTGIPLSPPLLNAPLSSTTSQRPVFSWSSVPGAIGYEVWVNNNSTGLAPIFRENVSGTTYTPSADMGIGSFSLWVRATGSPGTPSSAWTSTHRFQVNTPVTLHPVDADLSTGLPEISWDPLKGATSYEVWVDRTDIPASHVNGQTLVTESRFVLPYSVGQYKIWVRAIAKDGMKAGWSAVLGLTAFQVPGITAGFVPTFQASPTVSWTAVPGAASYEFYVLNVRSNTRVLYEQGLTSTSLTWPKFPAGLYRYWIRVTGASRWSRAVDLDTSGRTSFLVPTTVATKSQFSWRPVQGAVRYELWVDQPGIRERVIYRTELVASEYRPAVSLSRGNYRSWIRAIAADGTAAPWSLALDFSIV